MLGNKSLTYILLALSLALTSCLEEGSVTEGSTNANFGPPPPAEDTVCEPFDGENIPGAGDHGVKGILYYKGIDDPPFTHVDQYFTDGYLIPDLILFLNQLHIPTRPFDRGFLTQAGQQILTPEGNTLYEWFAVKYSGRIALAPDQPAGLYDISVLADDGAVLKVDEGAGYEILVDNDGTHPTRMGCASLPLYLDHENPIPFELNYNQGPRYHIALVVMMRPWTDTADSRCGQEGNSLFFDSTQDPPAPKPAYSELLSRGWVPLSPENYLMPAQEQNPCNQVAPIISGVSVSGIKQTSAVVSWMTDIFATSQVQITNAMTNQVVLTPEDMTYVLAHSVPITGLTANTLYRVRAISKSSSGLSTTSIEISFRTLR